MMQDQSAYTPPPGYTVKYVKEKPPRKPWNWLSYFAGILTAAGPYIAIWIIVELAHWLSGG